MGGQYVTTGVYDKSGGSFILSHEKSLNHFFRPMQSQCFYQFYYFHMFSSELLTNICVLCCEFVMGGYNSKISEGITQANHFWTLELEQAS